jgi:hypothetical protein
MKQKNLIKKTVDKNSTNAQQGFCVRRVEVQNSTAVFQLNISNNINFCASISRPNAKPRNVVCHFIKNPTLIIDSLKKRMFLEDKLEQNWKLKK